MKNKLIILSIAVALSALITTGCSKDEPSSVSPKATLKVSITDAPGDYEHIYLTVEEIAVKTGGNWSILTLNQVDTFDILDYTNGDQLLLAEGIITADSTSEIRLVLSDNNTLVLQDGSIHDLKVPSGTSSGLKIKLTTTSLQANQTYYVVLDFDASKSIVQKGNGTYSLKPVIRGYWDEGMGAVEGIALSPNYQVSVWAINGADTLGSSIADTSNGYYLIGGLPQANYNLYFNSSNGNDTLLNGVSVMQNITTLADTVNL